MKSDLEIQQDVMSELKWQPNLKSSKIGVAVNNGVVTLSGIVDNLSQKQEAEKAAKKVFGVKAIAEDIQIGVSPSTDWSDTKIAESVVSALKSHTGIPQNKLIIKVEDGVVTLDGEVDWQFQRDSAKNIVGNLLGVRHVLSHITVKPETKPVDVRTMISEALLRSATVDSSRITVEVIDSKVVLHGKVRSFAEKEDAENAAWCAPGITKVESYIEVQPTELYVI